uniref:(northern house mosquito) hypothetical protein n=1 Tax=Culex pipiens TaxID=7175 RepID=A0A8D8P4U9_CULPI
MRTFLYHLLRFCALLYTSFSCASTSLASCFHSAVLWSSSSGTQLTPSTMRIVPARSHSEWHRPGSVGLGVVVDVVVVVVVVVEVDDEASSFSSSSCCFCCSSSFSIESGVVEGVGQPVNSVVARVGGPRRMVISGWAGPSACSGFAVVTRPWPGFFTPGRLGKTTLKPAVPALSGLDSDFDSLKPGGSGTATSLNLILLSRLVGSITTGSGFASSAGGL